MVKGQLNGVVRHIRRLVAAENGGSEPDRDLLDRFVRQRDEAAFAALVHRHAAMVLAVCRRVLHNAHDAEDACQAAFLVLARRAGSIRKRDSLASWLYGVAYRAASNLKRGIVRRQAREASAAESARAAAEDLSWREVKASLDEELRRLPGCYQAPLILCYLEGKTRDEVARQLGWSPGAVKARLERGRDMLRSRLTRRGLTLSAGLAGLLAQDAVAMPALQVVTIVKAGLLVASGHMPAAGLVSARTILLMEGVLKSMFVAKIKIAGVLVVAASLVGAGLVLQTTGTLSADQPATAEPLSTAATGERQRDDSPATTTPEPQIDPKTLAAQQARSRDNLKQLALAMHNYLDVYGHFPPPAIYGGQQNWAPPAGLGGMPMGPGGLGGGMPPGRGGRKMPAAPGMPDIPRGQRPGGPGLAPRFPPGGGVPGAGAAPGGGAPPRAGAAPGAPLGGPPGAAPGGNTPPAAPGLPGAGPGGPPGMGIGLPGGSPPGGGRLGGGPPAGMMPRGAMLGGGMMGGPGGMAMPGGMATKGGKALLSWRVAILPYLGEGQLYKQFRLNESWDSPHNIKLLRKMPKVFAAPGIKTKVPYSTFYQVFVGKHAAFEKHRAMRIFEFLDGTSNTILIAEAGCAVPWTKPADLPFAADEPLPELGGIFSDVFHAALADGSVHTLSKDFDQETLRLAIMRDDGNPFDFDKIHKLDSVGALEVEKKRLTEAVAAERDRLKHLQQQKAAIQKHRDTPQQRQLRREIEQLHLLLLETRREAERLRAEIEGLRKPAGPNGK